VSTSDFEYVYLGVYLITRLFYRRLLLRSYVLADVVLQSRQPAAGTVNNNNNDNNNNSNNAEFEP